MHLSHSLQLCWVKLALQNDWVWSSWQTQYTRSAVSGWCAHSWSISCDPEDFLLCPFCLAFYVKCELYRHCRQCTFRYDHDAPMKVFVASWSAVLLGLITDDNSIRAELSQHVMSWIRTHTGYDLLEIILCIVNEMGLQAEHLVSGPVLRRCIEYTRTVFWCAEVYQGCSWWASLVLQMSTHEYMLYTCANMLVNKLFGNNSISTFAYVSLTNSHARQFLVFAVFEQVDHEYR